MLTLKIEHDPDPFPPDDLGEDIDSGVYLATTRNRYFQRNPDRLEQEQEDCWEFPLYMYQHSGTALSLAPFSCPWDSGRVGSVFVHKTRVGLNTEERARASASSYVEAWNQYLSGDVWGIVIEDDGQEVESCWGIYGEDYAKKEGERLLADVIRWHAEQGQKIEEVWAL